MDAYNELRIRNIELVITDIKEIDDALADPGDKAFHHALVDIGFGKLPTPAQVVKDLVQMIGQVFKHSGQIVTV